MNQVSETDSTAYLVIDDHGEHAEHHHVGRETVKTSTLYWIVTVAVRESDAERFDKR
jgi:hypothetical protein